MQKYFKLGTYKVGMIFIKLGQGTLKLGKGTPCSLGSVTVKIMKMTLKFSNDYV